MQWFHNMWPFRTLHIIAISLLGSGLHADSLSAQDDPDPLLLVQGAESARQQIPPSSLKLRFIYSDPITTNERVAVVDFEGEMRGYEHFSQSEKNNGWSSVFDGSRAITYEESRLQATYRSLKTEQNALMLFDPRLLGLISAYAWDQSLHYAFPYRFKREKLELIGREKVGRRLAWHVRFSFGPASTDYDYWIDDTSGFRVYRMDCNGVQTFSQYDNTNYTWLPSRVISKAFRHLHPSVDEIPWHTKDVQILEATANLNFPTTRWSLAGMKLKPGTEVVDLGLSRTIGMWDGKHLVKDLSTPPKMRLSVEERIIILVIMGLTTLIFIWDCSGNTCQEYSKPKQKKQP